MCRTNSDLDMKLCKGNSSVVEGGPAGFVLFFLLEISDSVSTSTAVVRLLMFNIRVRSSLQLKTKNLFIHSQSEVALATGRSSIWKCLTLMRSCYWNAKTSELLYVVVSVCVC